MAKEINIVEGRAVDNVLEDVSLGELTLSVLSSHEKKILQIEAVTRETLPANVVVNKAISLAKWFDSINLNVGDAVSICSENRLEFCIVPVAAFFNGITFAPVNPDYTARELHHCLNLSKPKVIFCSSGTFDSILSFSKIHPYLKYIVVFDKQRSKQRNIISFTDIIKDAADGPIDENFKAKSVNPKETVATILCSSGTTGLPKGVMCTHYNMVFYMTIAREMLEIDEDRTAIGVIPFFHSMGFMTMFLYLLGGNKFIVMKKFNPKVFLESISKYKVTYLAVPPPVILFLIKHPLAKNYDLSSLKFVLSGAAPLSKEVEEDTNLKFKTAHVGQGYGLTETTLGILLSPRGKAKIGSVGILVPGMQAKVLDEAGNALGANQEGELCFKGPLIMKGYVGDPGATAAIIDQDGWLHTGDIGYYDEEGYFYIVDRIKELIKYKAYQVAPAELEAILLTHPEVSDAAVVGLPDESAGELPLAFVVKKKNSKISAKDLEDFVAERVTSYKKLRGGVCFIKEIPRNASGKILRRILREQAQKTKSKL